MGLRDSFALFDTDGSGKLSAEEFKAVLTRDNVGSLSLFEADELLKAFDKNGDGELDINEFIEACGVLEATPAAASLAESDGIEERHAEFMKMDAEKKTFAASFAHGSAIVDLALSRDEATLVTAEAALDNVVLWDAVRGEPTQTLQCELGDGLCCFALTSDTGTLFTGHLDGTIAEWEVASGARKRTLRVEGKSRVWRLLLTKDDATLFSGDSDGRVVRFEVASGERQKYSSYGGWLACGGGSVRTLVLGTSAATLFVGSLLNVTRWDAGSGERKSGPEFAVERPILNCLTVAKDEATLFIGVGVEIVQWDVASGERKRTLKCDGIVSNLRLSADEKSLLSGDFGYWVVKWDVASGERKQAKKFDGDVNCVALASDEATLFVGQGKCPNGKHAVVTLSV